MSWPSLDRHQFISSLAALGCFAVVKMPAALGHSGMPSTGNTVAIGAPALACGNDALTSSIATWTSPRITALVSGALLGNRVGVSLAMSFQYSRPSFWRCHITLVQVVPPEPAITMPSFLPPPHLALLRSFQPLGGSVT